MTAIQKFKEYPTQYSKESLHQNFKGIFNLESKVDLKLSTSNSKLSTSNSKLSTSNSKLSTSNSELSTSNLELSTSNSKLCGVIGAVGLVATSVFAYFLISSQLPFALGLGLTITTPIVATAIIGVLLAVSKKSQLSQTQPTLPQTQPTLPQTQPTLLQTQPTLSVNELGNLLYNHVSKWYQNKGGSVYFTKSYDDYDNYDSLKGLINDLSEDIYFRLCVYYCHENKGQSLTLVVSEVIYSFTLRDNWEDVLKAKIGTENLNQTSINNLIDFLKNHIKYMNRE